jgi:hypothetical protein
VFTRNFWRQAAERAVKSSAQAVVGLGLLDGANVLHLDWQLAGGTALGAAVLSVLTSLITSGVGERNDPSAVAKTAP